MTYAKCRGERNDFSGLDGDLGPAGPITPSRSKWLVDRVVGEVLAQPSTTRPRIVNIRSIALAAIVATASAAAATMAHQRFFPNVKTSTPEIDTPKRAENRSAFRATGAASTISHESLPEVIPSILPSAAPIRSAPSMPQSTGTVAIADRMAAANELRRSGKWQNAEQAYLDIVARYPLVPEAGVASLAAASLRLEHLGDPAGALRLYKSLTRGSALGVEALYGVARCHQALGDTKGEIAALRNVVVSYPTSLQADRARERLQQIDSTSAGP